ncbi:hypothetical protein CMO89_04215 [Candidatus Woesearchaeota archaeon]|nr:hypothetical protein [Candidatus Woesearchaeota archaeon]|tara:strand:- start:8857 stop:9237 length:381 start_codon:yes stop_codon:yes gene_type:complete
MLNYKKHGLNFLKYSIVGGAWSAINVFLMWLLIDVISINTVIGSTSIVVVLFIARFYMYVAIDLMHKQFLKYTLTTVLLSTLNVGFMYVFVDMLYISALWSSITSISILFLFKFIIYNMIGLIKNV